MLRKVPMPIQVDRENERFERGKLKSRCFRWFPASMLKSLRRAPTWRLHTKHYKVTIIFSDTFCPTINSSSEYRTSPKPWHVVYFLLLLYDISAILFFTVRDN